MNLKPLEHLEKRQTYSKQMLTELRLWLDSSLGKVPPKSLTGKALAYMDSQWLKLIRFLDDPVIGPDTNVVENAVRPFAVGRKSWLFADTKNGSQASAALYSLISTARANEIEPYEYLAHLFTELPKATTIDEFEALLPWNFKRSA
jgi:transposase